jgi:uncharacterized SAM-binding protein YcdF (DUF218 family)
MLRRSLLAALVVTGVSTSAWFGRVWLLHSAADLWIVSDPIGPADAVAVFGGGLEGRPFAAAEYYQRGFVKKVLVSNVREGPAERLGVVASDTSANRAVLIKLGVRENDIEVFGTDVRNTHQEVLALLAWVEQAGAHSVIVPTEIFSTRRVRWMLHSVFPPTVAIRVPALEPGEYNQSNWWNHEAGLIAFQNEVVKYLYYRCRY